MASLSLKLLLAAGAYLISTVTAIDPQLVGTWTTKSAKVITGPVCFMDCNDDKVGSDHMEE